MTEKLTLEKANLLGGQMGAFDSLDFIRTKYGLKPKTVNRLYAHFFRLLKSQVDEAQREVSHLHEVLKRMEHTCRRGSYERQVTVIIGSPLLSEFERDMRALEGWVVSLFETYMSIYGFNNPLNVPGKIHELARSSWALWHERQVAKAPFLKDPAQFEYMLSP